MSAFMNERASFERFGSQFQEKLVQLILDDRTFADQMVEVMDLEFLELKYLRIFAEKVFEFRKKYSKHPTRDTITTILRADLDKENELLQKQVRDYFARVQSNGANIEDEQYIKDVALDFCKKQKLKEAMIKSVELVQTSSFEEVAKIINHAIKLGSDNNVGYDYMADFEKRFQIITRNAISTGWDLIDNITKGGLGRGELGVVIAPTGCHAKGTEILMLDGSIKKVEEVVVGESLIGPDSTKRTVQRLVRGNDRMFKIIPNNGSPFVVNGEHILSLKQSETDKIVNLSVYDYLGKSNSFKQFHKLWRVMPISFVRKANDDSLSDSFFKTGFMVEEQPRDDYYGFTVDKDSLYLMGDFTVTHNCGKSYFLCHLGATAIKSGLNVVHYTLELADIAVANRYDACLTGVSINDLPENKELVFDGIKDIQGKLVIKEYPTKSATIGTIRNHLEKVIRGGTRVDMVLVDYADLIKNSTKFEEKRHQLESVYEELRGIARTYNVVVYSASQTNRGALNSEVVTMDSISEAFSKCFVADFIFTFSRTMKDKETNTGRMFIAKNRNGVDGLVFPVFFDPSVAKIKVLPQSTETMEEMQQKSLKDQQESLRQKYQAFKKSQ